MTWRAGPTVGPATYRLSTALGVYVADLDAHTLTLLTPGRGGALKLDVSDVQCHCCPREYPESGGSPAMLNRWREHWFLLLRRIVNLPPGLKESFS